MTLSTFGARHPSLEELRNNVGLGPSMDFVIVELRSMLYKIHAGFLFLEEERNTLRQLCRSVGRTREGKSYSNWKEFASCLGLERDDISHIDLYFKNQEGPVLVALAAYVQRDDATLEKMINALQQTKRFDTINLISDSVRQLANRVDDYPSFIDPKTGIHRPTTLPWVPFSLELPSVKSNPTIGNIDEIINNATIFLEQDNNGTITSIKNNTPLAARVMLTFANDGVETASSIANILRSHKPERIGVLILKEQQNHYFVKTREFISDCIAQVDIIIPILTKGYYQTIRSLRTEAQERLGRFAIDQQYAKYIHLAYTSLFLNNLCRHKQVRCILPNDEEYEPFAALPELEIYFYESEIDEFINLILSETAFKRNNTE